MIFEKKILDRYKGMMYTRCDDTETVFYFSPKDFDGLLAEPYPFTSREGNTLQGYIYQYENPLSHKLIIFDHGFGGGHRAYMKEIELICKMGYSVFAYDHTGCMESGGVTPGGLGHSLSDLNDCITAIKRDERFKGMELSVIGHSWGAYSTMNISALHPEISHVVAMCGFVSVEEMIKTFFSGLLSGYRKAIMKLEREQNPNFVDFNAVKTLSRSRTRALLIYSENDSMCRKAHYDSLKAGLEGRENVRFMLCKNKGHNPNYTEDAVKLLKKFGKARAKLLRKKSVTEEEKERFVASFDWNAMTAQDESVWKAIFDHLES